MSKLGIMDILNSHFRQTRADGNRVMLLYVNIDYTIDFAILKREIENFGEKLKKMLK